MNIFYTHHLPSECARDHCDKHVVKMIIEYAQLLSTAHHVLDGDSARDGIYRLTHKNHPSATSATSKATSASGPSASHQAGSINFR